MRDRKNADRRFRFEVDDPVREAFDGRMSDEQIGCESPHERSGVRQLDDLVDCGVDSVEELEAESHPPLLIPSSGGAVLSFGLVLESNA
jgi:hypothetical protein